MEKPVTYTNAKGHVTDKVFKGLFFGYLVKNGAYPKVIIVGRAFFHEYRDWVIRERYGFKDGKVIFDNTEVLPSGSLEDYEIRIY